MMKVYRPTPWTFSNKREVFFQYVARIGSDAQSIRLSNRRVNKIAVFGNTLVLLTGWCLGVAVMSS